MRVESSRCGNGKCFYFFGEMIFRPELEDQARAQAICGTLVFLCRPRELLTALPEATSALPAWRQNLWIRRRLWRSLQAELPTAAETDGLLSRS
jgi:hypothetical protein